MEMNTRIPVRNGYDYKKNIENCTLQHKDRLTKADSDGIVRSKPIETSGASRPKVVCSQDAGQPADFAKRLETARAEIVSDLKKQQAIDRKEQIKEQVKSGTYIADARAIAAKMMISEFDLTV